MTQDIDLAHTPLTFFIVVHINATAFTKYHLTYKLVLCVVESQLHLQNFEAMFILFEVVSPITCTEVVLYHNIRPSDNFQISIN